MIFLESSFYLNEEKYSFSTSNFYEKEKYHLYFIQIGFLFQKPATNN